MEELKVTSPEEYAEIIERKQRDSGEYVPLPSGMVVRARRADMEGLALKGGLPMSLVRSSQNISNSNETDFTPEQIDEGTKALIFMRELTRKNCLEPQVVYDEAGEVVWRWADGTTREIDTADFKALAAWIRGEEVDGLNSFRGNRKQRRASASKSGRKALQSESVVAAT